MSAVIDLLADKGSRVYCISPHATVLEATRLMNEHKIGALVVREQDRLSGVFTERDVLRRVVAEQLDPAKVRVEQVMTRNVVTCAPDTDIEEASRLMRDRRVRHLPVCDEDGRLRGLISIGDVNAHYVSMQQAHIHFLNDYVYGRA